jgi:CRP-like cAMP-binding protein
VGEGRTISQYRKDQIVFSQGDPADAVFYIQKGKVKVTVVSEGGGRRDSWSGGVLR